MIRKYSLIIEGDDGYSGYVPELPTILVTGSSMEDLTARAREAIQLYHETLRADRSRPRPFAKSKSRLRFKTIVLAQQGFYSQGWLPIPAGHISTCRGSIDLPYSRIPIGRLASDHTFVRIVDLTGQFLPALLLK